MTYNEMKELLKYDPDTGVLAWKHRPWATKGWNTRYAGCQAGNLSGDGYLQFCVRPKMYKAHRVVWLLHYGSWPVGDLDHINGVKTDNRIVNLRDVNNQDNHKNTKLRSDNKSGYHGITICSRTGYWRVSGDNTTIMVTPCLPKAVIARKSFEVSNGFHINHGGR